MDRDRDPATWVEDHGDVLYRFALARVRNPTIAEDLVQDTLLAGVKSIDRFTGAASVRTWLVSILKHKIIDHFRKANREVATGDETVADWTEDEYLDRKGRWKKRPPEWVTNPEKAYERKEFWGVLESCMGKLKERQHRAFVMRELEGRSSEAICEELDITSSNLYILLFRARASLKSCLEANWTEA